MVDDKNQQIIGIKTVSATFCWKYLPAIEPFSFLEISKNVVLIYLRNTWKTFAYSNQFLHAVIFSNLKIECGEMNCF